MKGGSGESVAALRATWLAAVAWSDDERDHSGEECKEDYDYDRCCISRHFWGSADAYNGCRDPFTCKRSLLRRHGKLQAAAITTEKLVAVGSTNLRQRRSKLILNPAPGALQSPVDLGLEVHKALLCEVHIVNCSL
jgi:hypothetical protein